jgi:hypothetical protein
MWKFIAAVAAARVVCEVCLHERACQHEHYIHGYTPGTCLSSGDQCMSNVRWCDCVVVLSIWGV